MFFTVTDTEEVRTLEPEKIITLGRLFVDGAEGTARRLAMSGTGCSLIGLVHVTDSTGLYVGGPDVAKRIFPFMAASNLDTSQWFKRLDELPRDGIGELADFLDSRHFFVVGEPTAGSSGAFLIVADEDWAEWWATKLGSKQCPDPTENDLFFLGTL